MLPDPRLSKFGPYDRRSSQRAGLPCHWPVTLPEALPSNPANRLSTLSQAVEQQQGEVTGQIVALRAVYERHHRRLQAIGGVTDGASAPAERAPGAQRAHAWCW